MEVRNFNKVIVNAVDYGDLKVFALALCEAMEQGKRYLLRTAASLVKVMGGISICDISGKCGGGRHPQGGSRDIAGSISGIRYTEYNGKWAVPYCL